MEIVKFKGHEPGSLNQAFSGLQGQWVTQGTEGDLTTFTSTVSGTGQDNPTSPSTLTDQQKDKSISAKWLNTACVEFTFQTHGEMEKGRSFLFSGSVDARDPCPDPPPPPSPPPPAPP